MTSPVTVAGLLGSAAGRLAASSPSPRADAELLLCHSLGWSRARLFSEAAQAMAGDIRAGFETLLARRLAGEPVAYLTGERGFWTLDLRVNRHVLIPRPETELVVERALALVSGTESRRVLDLGTGSGAIALALAGECPPWRISAIEQCSEALAVARDNGERLGLAVEWHTGSWFEPLHGQRFDLIVSNPPYVAAGDPHLSRGDLRFEPTAALTAGTEGLDALRRIVTGAPDHLLPGGWLILEHGYDQADAVQDLLRSRGFRQIASHRDLGGQPRVTEGRRA